MEEPPPTELDWSNLQADILITVLCKLEFPDFFRSAAVCTTWLAAAHALRRLGLYNRPQTPCLLYTNAAGSPRVAELFSLADKSTYKMHLPDPPIRKRRIIGSSHGWLVTADSRSELHLLNPATGEQISLPPVATMEHVSPVFDHTGRLQRYDLSFYDATLPRKEYDRQPYLPGEFRDVLYRKVVLSCDPSRRGCIAMMIHNPRRQLSFARVVGDSKWHWVATSLHGSNYSDCIFHDGAFYAMNLQGGIHRYTIAGTSSGQVLQIWKWGSYTRPDPDELHARLHTTSIGISRVDLDKQNIVGVDTLGDDALFIGHNYTWCLSTMDYPGLLPNHVYFTDDTDYWRIHGTVTRRDAKIYSLEDKSVCDLVSPQRWTQWPIPIWITPSFNKIHK